MEDSPLIKQIDNTSHINSTSATANNSSHVQTQLMVNATNPGSDSTSAMSSSSSTSSSSSCNSCCAPSVGTYLPKSSSNPMLLTLVNQNSSSSLASTGSSSIAPSSPTSVASMCVNSASTGNLSHQFQANGNVLDLFINKKSPPTDSNSGLDNYDSYNSSTNTSIVTVASNASLLTSVSQHQQQTGAINSAVETAAKKYRCAAQISEATCCWKGKLQFLIEMNREFWDLRHFLNNVRRNFKGRNIVVRNILLF